MCFIQHALTWDLTLTSAFLEFLLPFFKQVKKESSYGLRVLMWSSKINKVRVGGVQGSCWKNCQKSLLFFFGIQAWRMEKPISLL